MTTSETRFALLGRLAWELRGISVTSLLVVPASGEPVLWVMGNGGRRDAVLAVPRPEKWQLLWRGRELEVADALQTIARAVAA
jgi:hypothetical protein